MKASEFDSVFDDGESVTEHLDLSSARRPNLERKRVNVDSPDWMIELFDRALCTYGATRQSVIK